MNIKAIMIVKYLRQSLVFNKLPKNAFAFQKQKIRQIFGKNNDNNKLSQEYDRLHDKMDNFDKCFFFYMYINQISKTKMEVSDPLYEKFLESLEEVLQRPEQNKKVILDTYNNLSMIERYLKPEYVILNKQKLAQIQPFLFEMLKDEDDRIIRGVMSIASRLKIQALLKEMASNFSFYIKNQDPSTITSLLYSLLKNSQRIYLKKKNPELEEQLLDYLKSNENYKFLNFTDQIQILYSLRLLFTCKDDMAVLINLIIANMLIPNPEKVKVDLILVFNTLEKLRKREEVKVGPFFINNLNRIINIATHLKPHEAVIILKGYLEEGIDVGKLEQCFLDNKLIEKKMTIEELNALMSRLKEDEINRYKSKLSKK